MGWLARVAFFVSVSLLASAAAAQNPVPPFDASVQVSWVRSSQFDATRAGIGGRVAWHPLDLLGVEAEVAFYPGDWPDGTAISSSQREALFGVTFGPRFERVRPFLKVRPGLVRLAEAPAPFACILIFPPPLSCRLAAGETLAAVDYGGGVEVAAGRGFVRVDVGDRMVRYPGPVLDQRRNRRDGTFWSHDLRVGLGAGVRF